MARIAIRPAFSSWGFTSVMKRSRVLLASSSVMSPDGIRNTTWPVRPASPGAGEPLGELLGRTRNCCVTQLPGEPPRSSRRRLRQAALRGERPLHVEHRRRRGASAAEPLARLDDQRQERGEAEAGEPLLAGERGGEQALLETGQLGREGDQS